MSNIDNVDCAIIGGGPAGCTAAIYLARAGKKVVLFVGVETVSQAGVTSYIYNYPGLEGINGHDLADKFVQQAESQGAIILYEDVYSVDASQRPFAIKHGWEDHTMMAKSVIIATGAEAIVPELDGVQKYWQSCISACAVCDGDMTKEAAKKHDIVNVIVVGGGDVAAEDANYLSNLIPNAKVTMLLRRDTFRASKAMVDRVLANPKVTVLYNSQLNKINGNDEELQSIEIIQNGETKEIPANCMFFAMGRRPHTQLFKNIPDLLDEQGYVKLVSGQTTPVPGIFAAGDCSDKVYRQVIVAAGNGCKAALDCERWLKN